MSLWSKNQPTQTEDTTRKPKKQNVQEAHKKCTRRGKKPQAIAREKAFNISTCSIMAF